MTKFLIKLTLLSAVCAAQMTFAHTTTDKNDLYDQCVDQTIQQLNLESINNMVVQTCSNQAKEVYEKQIVGVLDQIRIESQQSSQTERYLNLLKSQRLWKSYVDKECDNAGEYIGSPMYSYCPMQEYRKRVEQLKEYLND